MEEGACESWQLEILKNGCEVLEELLNMINGQKAHCPKQQIHMSSAPSQITFSLVDS